MKQYLTVLCHDVLNNFYVMYVVYIQVFYCIICLYASTY